ncbi:hypothetical protein RCZ04_22750 [Capnocytophaga sp. HP1101]
MNLEYSLYLSEEAKKELKSIIVRYDMLQEGLGVKVLDDIQKGLEYLKFMPFICPKRYGDIRVLYTKKYKIAVYYYIVEDEMRMVSIYSFSHQKENPVNVLKRINF